MKRSIWIAFAILAMATAWILSGSFGPFAHVKEAETKAPVAVGATVPGAGEDLIAVRAKRSLAAPYATQIVARGRTQAIRTVEVKSEVTGRVVAIDAPKGARVKAGDSLVRFAVEDRAARLAETEALVRQRDLEYVAAKVLAEKGYRPENKLAEQAALLDAARARLKQMEVEMTKLTVRAPFAGVIEQKSVELGDFIAAGAKLVTIVDEDPYLVVGHVTELEVGRIKTGDIGRARLITGEEVEGRLRYVASTADQATRTFRIELEVPNKERVLRDGTTAEIRVDTSRLPAHLISPSALTLNDRGQVGLRLVDADRVVRFAAVAIVGQARAGVWVAGLPEQATIITVGQESVKDGQPVKVVLDEEGR
jgi:multidrug efflux system membrane fusion protein